MSNDRSNVKLVGNTTQGQNIGTGTANIYVDKLNGNTLRFRRLKEGANISITQDGDDIIISGATGGGGGGSSTGTSEIQLSDGSGGFCRVQDNNFCAKYENFNTWTFGRRITTVDENYVEFPQMYGEYPPEQGQFVYGNINAARGYDNVTMGNSNINSGYGNFVSGVGNVACGAFSIAMGDGVCTFCGENIGLGVAVRAYGGGSIGIGGRICVNPSIDLNDGYKFYGTVGIGTGLVVEGCESILFGNESRVLNNCAGIGIGNYVCASGIRTGVMGFGYCHRYNDFFDVQKYCLTNTVENSLLIGTVWETNFGAPPAERACDSTKLHLKPNCIELNKPIQIIDETQGAGKVLTSDANGLGSWQTPSGGGGGVTSITAGTGLNGGTITTTGTISANFGSTSGTIAEGNDSRFHNAVTLGTANGLSLTGQQISMAVASGTVTGTVNTSTQTFGGIKTFQSGINLTGTNTDDTNGHIRYNSTNNELLLYQFTRYTPINSSILHGQQTFNDLDYDRWDYCGRNTSHIDRKFIQKNNANGTSTPTSNHWSYMGSVSLNSSSPNEVSLDIPVNLSQTFNVYNICLLGKRLNSYCYSENKFIINVATNTCSIDEIFERKIGTEVPEFEILEIDYNVPSISIQFFKPANTTFVCWVVHATMMSV